MKVTIDFGDEINVAVQRHLDGGGSVREYVRSAVDYFNQMYAEELAGKSCGYGDKNRFSTYNSTCNPSTFLVKERD